MDPVTEGRSGRGPLIALGTIGVLTVLAGVLFVTGELRAQPSGPESVRPGTSVDQGLFSVRVESARVTTLKLRPLGKPERALVVRMWVADKDRRTAPVGSPGGFLDGVAAGPRPGQYAKPEGVSHGVAIDGGNAAAIHPGLPIEVEAVWRLTAAGTPRQAVVAFRPWQHARGFLDERESWTVDKDGVAALVTVPVAAS